MAEALGAASSVLALTILAFQTSKTVYDTTDLGALVAVLDLIRQQAQASEDDRKFEPLREPVRCCITICQEMQEMVNICTKHVKDGRESVRDWLNMQYRQKSFADFKQRLASYKSTLSITFASINIQEHATTQDSLTELKRSIEGTKEDLEDQLVRVETAMIDAGASLRALLLADQAQLQSCLDSLMQAQSVTETNRAQIVIERNRAGEHSRTLLGTDTSRPEFNLTVSDNQAQFGAVMGAGVHSPETLQALLQGWRAADVMLVLQTLQTQSPSADVSTLQFFLSDTSAGRREGTIDSPSILNSSAGLTISKQEASLMDVEAAPNRTEHTND